VEDPAKIISGIFVRPEDLEVFEEVGVHRFKVSGRNRSTDWLVRSARAYAARSYPGNLLDILSLVQVKGPLASLKRIEDGPQAEEARSLAAAFAPLAEMTVDNRAFPPDFFRHVAGVDCEHTSCAVCGYCRGVAEKVLRVAGRPVTEYAPPADLPPAIRMLPALGAPPR